MRKSKLAGAALILGISLLLFGFVMCCSGIQFPFFNAKSDLNRHLDKDFGITLPTSATLDNSYWVAARDPESVYALHVNPADIAPFFTALHAASATKLYEEQDLTPARTHPLYGAPPWWNNPPLADPATLNVITKDLRGSAVANYEFLYSPTNGKIYVSRGEF